jgi:hypothetical protein
MKPSNAKPWRWFYTGAKRLSRRRRIGVSQYSIYQWKKKSFPLGKVPESMGKPSPSSGLPEDVGELQKLVREKERQIADLTQQREILKKTRGIVCEGPSNGTNGLKK